MFDQLREYNLKLKPSKCSLFKEEINYLAHQVSKQGVQASDANIKAIADCVLLQTYMDIHAFLGLVGHYRQFIKGFTWIAQPLNEHLAREGASRKSELVSLSKDALDAQRAEGDDPAMVEGDHDIEKEVHVTAGQVLVEMHVTNWAAAQREDPKLDPVLHWLEAKKKTDLRTLLGEHASSEEGQIVWRNCRKFHGPPRCPLSVLYTQMGE